MSTPRPSKSLLDARMLYTAPQVAEILNVHVSTIYAWVKQGHFPAPRRLGVRTVRWSGRQIMDHVMGTVLA